MSMDRERSHWLGFGKVDLRCWFAALVSNLDAVQFSNQYLGMFLKVALFTERRKCQEDIMALLYDMSQQLPV